MEDPIILGFMSPGLHLLVPENVVPSTSMDHSLGRSLDLNTAGQCQNVNMPLSSRRNIRACCNKKGSLYSDEILGSSPVCCTRLKCGPLELRFSHLIASGYGEAVHKP